MKASRESHELHLVSSFLTIRHLPLPVNVSDDRRLGEARHARKGDIPRRMCHTHVQSCYRGMPVPTALDFGPSHAYGPLTVRVRARRRMIVQNAYGMHVIGRGAASGALRFVRQCSWSSSVPQCRHSRLASLMMTGNCRPRLRR